MWLSIYYILFVCSKHINLCWSFYVVIMIEFLKVMAKTGGAKFTDFIAYSTYKSLP